MRRSWIVLAILAGAAGATVPRLASRAPHSAEPTTSVGPAVGMPGAPPTTADGLRTRVAEMEARLHAAPDDIGASVLLADALLRQARATTDGRPANRAAEVLQAVLAKHPSQYDALRMFGAIDLSRHRFREALDTARRARDQRPSDAWNYGVMGDALLELGDYDEAFAAFDKMALMRPNADAYARVAYARELRGDLDGALQAMQMAAGATTPHDVEAKAWATSQVGELLLKIGRLGDAAREFQRARFFFPDYPLAWIGQGKVSAARGDREGALSIYTAAFKRTPTLDLASRIGDLHAQAGRRAEAERYFQIAEDLAGPGVAQTESNLALFLADHDRKLTEAIRIAEAVATVRHDIFTDDALAWAYFKGGRQADALAASARAMRTGSRDERILGHAAAIRRASSGRRDSSRLTDLYVAGS